MKFLFFNLLNEGGPIFMYPLLLLLIVCIALTVKAFIKRDENTVNLIKHLSLFALVWGFLGQMIGLIGAFDSIQSFGNVAPEVLAGGLKVALLNPTFGMVVFLVARFGLILLAIKNKK